MNLDKQVLTSVWLETKMRRESVFLGHVFSIEKVYRKSFHVRVTPPHGEPEIFAVRVERMGHNGAG